METLSGKQGSSNRLDAESNVTNRKGRRRDVGRRSNCEVRATTSEVQDDFGQSVAGSTE